MHIFICSFTPTVDGEFIFAKSSTAMFLGGRRKPENPEETLMDPVNVRKTILKLRIEPYSCEVTM